MLKPDQAGRGETPQNNKDIDDRNESQENAQHVQIYISSPTQSKLDRKTSLLLEKQRIEKLLTKGINDVTRTTEGNLDSQFIEIVIKLEMHLRPVIALKSS